jgi:hypothetical protein
MKWSNDQVYRLACEKAAIKMEKHDRLPDGWSNTGIGFVVRGSIFDCDQKYFDRVLKTYFKELYFGWNPFKNNGQGVWEVWQRPLTKTAVLQAECKSYSIVELRDLPTKDNYAVYDMSYHVYDLPYLTPEFVNKLREMDAWENQRFFQDADDEQDEMEARNDRAEEESIKYAVRHHKSLFGKLKQYAQDGYNPFWFFSDKRQGDGQV